MLDNLKPKTLSSLAREWNSNPFELLRLRVMSQSDLSTLTMSSKHAEQLRVFSGIEILAERIPNGVESGLSGHLWVQPLVGLLLEDGYVGEQTTCIENVWRGLSPDDVTIVKKIVQLLIQEGILIVYSSITGVQVAVHGAAVDRAKAFVSGEVIPTALSYLWANEQ